MKISRLLPFVPILLTALAIGAGDPVPKYATIYQHDGNVFSVWDSDLGKKMDFQSLDESMNYMAGKGYYMKQAVVSPQFYQIQVIMERK